MSQKIPIFSVPGEPYNLLLMRIANQTDADVVIIGGMGLTFKEYQAFIDNAEASGSMNKTVMFVHRATDPAVECILVPASRFAARCAPAAVGRAREIIAIAVIVKHALIASTACRIYVAVKIICRTP